MQESGNRSGWADWLCALERELGEPGADWLNRIAYQVIDRARLSRGQVVADLGAGTGLVALRAAKEVGPSGEVLAVDSSGACLDILLERALGRGLSNITVLRGSLESLPIETSLCDAALCRSALVYADDLDAAVSEIERVLVPGGRFSVFEPLPKETSWVELGRGGYLDEEFGRMERTLTRERASYRIDRVVLRRAFEAAGFDEVESLILHYTVDMRGRGEETILREYLWDLPGEMAAIEVLKREMLGERALAAARSLARHADAGDVALRLLAMLVSGVKTA